LPGRSPNSGLAVALSRGRAPAELVQPRQRPKATGTGQGIMVRLQKASLARLDNWAAKQEARRPSGRRSRRKLRGLAGLDRTRRECRVPQKDQPHNAAGTESVSN